MKNFFFACCSASLIFMFPLLLSQMPAGGSIRQESKKSAARKHSVPEGYFISPVDSAISIAGNFGEIRSHHFHAGLDIRTGNREGLPVYAVADGYVSRIKISPYGYGKALYITHPNGYVSVYAHLQRFYGKIEKYVRQEQYRKETFETELFPPKDSLKVKQKDTVAVSGNTGGSSSPHLHFEIRDEKTGHALNPFLFGYKVKDTLPPGILTLAVYPIDSASFVNKKNAPRKIKVYGSSGNYKISSSEKITVWGKIGFGIETVDYANDGAGKLGVYSIELRADGKIVYCYRLNEISFDETRYLNTLVDYAETIRSKKEIQKCFLPENNFLSIYQCLEDEGKVDISDTLVHKIEFIVKDFFGNASKISFKVKGKKSKVLPGKSQKLQAGMFRCTEENTFQTKDVFASIPPCTLYEDIDFFYSKSKDTLPGMLSPAHTIHTPEVPLHAPYTLLIKAKPGAEKYFSKATIVSVGKTKDGKIIMYDQKGKHTPAVMTPGEFWVSASLKSFGTFAVTIDTVPPVIKPQNIYSGKNLKKNKTIALTVTDNLTGIASWRATIDDKWVLMEYDYKKNLLFYEFNEKIENEKHAFQLEVSDGKGNKSVYKSEFVR